MAADRRTLGQLCCDLVLATELSGEVERFARWNDVVQRSAAESDHPQLTAFCAVCCAEVFCARGDWSLAERELRSAISVLRRTGHRARCVPPAAKLAELYLLQGRIEEAAQLIGRDDSDASLLVRARLALERCDPALAVTLLNRHCRRSGGDSLLTAPAIALLIDAQVAR
ncbi:MAG: hypothetical protein GEV07_13215 [Streptosporangiales bacterium]|nr:hypothetical protein [Streptosporangiales bacterium]